LNYIIDELKETQIQTTQDLII